MSEFNNNELNDFEALRISLASTEKIKSWSKGVVKKPETINYRTLKPEKDGLFCEKIFGPTKDWECHCGKYKRIRYKGIVCDRCGVEVTKAKVRRERMGHIELAAPVSHIWYFKGIPSRIGLVLDISPKDLEKILYFAAYIVTDKGETDLEVKQILSEDEYREYKARPVLTESGELEGIFAKIRNNGVKEVSVGNNTILVLKEDGDSSKSNLSPGAEMVMEAIDSIYRKVEQYNSGSDELQVFSADEAKLLRGITIINDPGQTEFEKGQVLIPNIYQNSSEARLFEMIDGLSERMTRELEFKSRAYKFEAGMGAEAVRELLTQIELEELSVELRENLSSTTGQKKIKLVRRLDAIESLKASGNKPEWMILEVIPVIPPDIRPMVQLDGGRFATSDLNDLYRRVINRNNRLTRLLNLNAPDIIVRNEKRMLQEAVDALIDNGRRGRPVTGPGSRPLKSLSDMLKGKQGRFRQNLLGKRVDYSGRSVIVVGPELKFYQCGLPKRMALELFKPFIMKELVENDYAHNIKSAKRMVDKIRPEVWDVLDEVIKEHPVLLNRAPTLHRLGIQAFEPVLVEGKAIQLHPLVCTAYNADFDGDQMAVHVPLTVEAQAEARFLMLSVNNILAPKDGSPITTPTQDMILGSYYLTHPGLEDRSTDAEKGDGKIFSNYEEMLMAYRNKVVGLHAKVKVRRYDGEDDKRGQLVESTVGRFIFNEHIPQDLGFVENRLEDKYSLEVDFLCDKKQLGRIIDRCYRRHGNTKTALMLDRIKEMGFHYSTIAAVTISVSDMEIPEAKHTIIAEADKKVAEYEKAYRSGLMSESERYEGVVRTWTNTTDKVTDALMENLGTLNNLFIMSHSGARGSKNQIRQIGGMRGLMANAVGRTIEIPIKANFREGLSVLEYFISTNGARKGLADTALRTAESGYLTRRLVDVSHNVIVREEDCGSEEGIIVEAFTQGKEIVEKLEQRIIGRTSSEDIVHPETGEVIVERNAEINEDDADKIVAAGITKVGIRSVMKCQSETGICAKCYGRNLATGEPVNIGEAVGIQAAQSIGEPGTQLTMRTFHTGGVAGGDITQGLPRVEELFEARKPKVTAAMAINPGTVTGIEHNPETDTKQIRIKNLNGEIDVYDIPYEFKAIVEKKQEVDAGEELTTGPLYPRDILEVRGVEGVYKYLLKEVQRVYKMQGVDINDKHIEIIVSQMLSKFKITDSGDTTLLPDSFSTRPEIDAANNALEDGQAQATFTQELQGITKASLATDSFLSAASFQETTRVLTDAAIKGKTDRLLGLKENVIIGKLIPAGTGMKRYKNVDIDYGINEQYMVEPKAHDDDEDMDNEEVLDLLQKTEVPDEMPPGMPGFNEIEVGPSGDNN